MEKLEKLFKIEGNKYISFEIRYQKESVTPLTRTRRPIPGGVYLYMTPFVKVDDERVCDTFSDITGFGMLALEVLLKSLNRKSAKLEEWFFDVLESKEAEIRDLIEKRDFRGIEKLALSMAEA